MGASWPCLDHLRESRRQLIRIIRQSLQRLSEKTKRASKREPTSLSEEQKTRHRSLLSATDTRAPDALQPFFRQALSKHSGE
jgi:hypothetical protein